LRNSFEVSSGIQSGADKLTASNSKLLTAETVRKHTMKIGNGIFVLNEKELSDLQLPAEELKIVKKFFKNSHIRAFITMPHERTRRAYLIYSYKIELDEYPETKRHLEKYRSILQNKREYREGRREWFELQWPRQRRIFESPKIVNPQRIPADSSGFFAYVEDPFYASVDVYFIRSKKGTQESLLYLLGVLNSRVVRFWLERKSKRKGSALELYQTPLEAIPIRYIDFEKADEIALHDSIVTQVTKIRKTMFLLLEYSEHFCRDLTTLRTGEFLPEVDLAAVISDLPDSRLHSIRTHPDIQVVDRPKINDASFFLQKVSGPGEKPDQPEIELFDKNKHKLVLSGPLPLLRLVGQLLPSWKTRSWREIKENLLVPETITIFTKHKKKLLAKAESARQTLATQIDAVDHLVCDLYNLSDKEAALLIAQTRQSTHVPLS